MVINSSNPNRASISVPAHPRASIQNRSTPDLSSNIVNKLILRVVYSPRVMESGASGRRGCGVEFLSTGACQQFKSGQLVSVSNLSVHIRNQPIKSHKSEATCTTRRRVNFHVPLLFCHLICSGSQRFLANINLSIVSRILKTIYIHIQGRHGYESEVQWAPGALEYGCLKTFVLAAGCLKTIVDVLRFSIVCCYGRLTNDARSILIPFGLDPCSATQRQIFKFHRAIIRTAREKEPGVREGIMKYAREQFEKHHTVDKRDVMRIEHLLRKGAKQLELAQEPEFSGISASK